MTSQSIKFEQFHHRAISKKTLSSIDTKKVSKVRLNKQSHKKTILGFIWRYMLPFALRSFITALIDERYYRTKIESRVSRIKLNDGIAISDRFIYDRMVDLNICNRHWSQRFALFINTIIIKKPDLIIFLRDKPHLIVKRKQEFSVDETKVYQYKLEKIIRFFRTPCFYIDIDNRAVNLIAIDASNKIVSLLD